MNPALWTLWRCERGGQWTTTDHGTDHAEPCEFSGCDKQPHMATRIARTDCRELAANWFTRPRPAMHMFPSVYKVSCYSRCGSYFMPYLKSVTVIADNPDDAIAKTEAYLKKQGRSFIYGKEHWKAARLYDATNLCPVIDTEEQADY